MYLQTSQLGSLKSTLKKVGKVVSAPLKDARNLVTHPASTLKADAKRIGSAFSGKNHLDPFAILATVTSPELRALDKSLKAGGVKQGAALPANFANKVFSPLDKKLHELDPVTRTLRKKIPIFKTVTDWTAAKPATAIAAIITGASLASGAAGGGGAAAAGGGEGGAVAAGGGAAGGTEGAGAAALAALKKEAVKLAQGVGKTNAPAATSTFPVLPVALGALGLLALTVFA